MEALLTLLIFQLHAEDTLQMFGVIVSPRRHKGLGKREVKD